jgi:hypothetical protein
MFCELEINKKIYVVVAYEEGYHGIHKKRLKNALK